MVAVLVIAGIGTVLPDGISSIVLAVAYAVTIRHLAVQRFGAMITSHRAAGGDLMSWWKVVGVALLVALIVFAIAFVLVLVLSQLGILAA